MTDDLRQRYADTLREALRADCEDTEDPLVDCLGCTVDVVLGVRDEEMERLRAELARLRAGEADHLPPEDAVHAPAEWIRRWNDEAPEKRLKVIERLLDTAGRGHRCFMLNHEVRLTDAEQTLTELAPLSLKARADRAEASNARVREIHAPDRIYQDCGHDGHPEDESPDLIEVGADGGMVCANSPYTTACSECCIDNDEQTAHCIDHHDHTAGWICDTRTALDEPEANHD